MIRALSLVVLFVSACAMGPRAIVGPDGRRIYAVQCYDPASCLEAAGESCPHGYSSEKDMYICGYLYARPKYEFLYACK